MLFTVKKVRLKEDLVGNPSVICTLAPNQLWKYRLGEIWKETAGQMPELVHSR